MTFHILVSNFSWIIYLSFTDSCSQCPEIEIYHNSSSGKDPYHLDIYGRYKKQNETINNRVYYLKGEFVVFYDGRGHWFVGLESELHDQVNKGIGITASLQ